MGLFWQKNTVHTRLSVTVVSPVQVQIKETVGDFQQMIQERLNKVEEIKNCLKLSAVSSLISNISYLCNGVRALRGGLLK